MKVPDRNQMKIYRKKIKGMRNRNYIDKKYEPFLANVQQQF